MRAAYIRGRRLNKKRVTRKSYGIWSAYLSVGGERSAKGESALGWVVVVLVFRVKKKWRRNNEGV